ncbi:MAG TPA: AAA family ATPase, partial [Candidatus Limnocylindrales bacterium]|nr:AAA family ATPase [Candidatus Limnocylindrales bacterium]
MSFAQTSGPATLIGRRDEQNELKSVVTDRDAPMLARLIDGPPGAGKTALLGYVLQEATRSGAVVMRMAPAAAESSLPYAGLGDLFDGVSAERLADLPAAQQRALGAALTHGTAADESNSHAVARAVVSVLRSIAERELLVVAVDDLQWLDSASSRALLFAMRRLADVRVRFVLTRRPDEATDWWDALRRALPEHPRWRIPLGPLTVDEVAALLGARLDLRLPRPTIVTIHRRSEGIPLFALELGRAVLRGRQQGSGAADQTEDLTSLLAGRLLPLGAPARAAVLATSLASQPTFRMLVSIAGKSGVEQAINAEVLQRRDDRIRLVHPLFGSAAESLASTVDRAVIHTKLAGLVPDEEEAALHRARGASDPSAATSADLEMAAGRAVHRGAPEMAAELAEHAARLTPADDSVARTRRLVVMADQLLAAGDPQRARAVLEELAAGMSRGPERADVLWRLADSVGDDLALSTRLSEQALAEAGDNAELKTSVRLALGVFTWLSGDMWASLEHVREAARLAVECRNDQLTAIALGEVMHAEAVLGLDTDPAVYDRALALEATMASFPPAMRPTFQKAVVCIYTDRLDEARPLLNAELMRAEASGDESARVAVLFRMSELELRAGNWALATRQADECLALATQAGIEQEQCVALDASAAVSAHLGRVHEATTAAEQALAIATGNGDEISVLRSRGVLGFVSLSVGDLRAADHWLAPGLATIERLDIGELSIYGVVQNQLDVLIGMGRHDAAQVLIELLRRKAGPQRRAWHLAVAARGHAMLAGARGNVEEALAQIALALAEHSRLPQPFEYGRTLLAKGSIERRHGKRTTARATLAEALEVFDNLGAALWAEAAAAELARISGRTPASGSLTDAETRVASLV